MPRIIRSASAALPGGIDSLDSMLSSTAPLVLSASAEVSSPAVSPLKWSPSGSTGCSPRSDQESSVFEFDDDGVEADSHDTPRKATHFYHPLRTAMTKRLGCSLLSFSPGLMDSPASSPGSHIGTGSRAAHDQAFFCDTPSSVACTSPQHQIKLRPSEGIESPPLSTALSPLFDLHSPAAGRNTFTASSPTRTTNALLAHHSTPRVHMTNAQALTVLLQSEVSGDPYPPSVARAQPSGSDDHTTDPSTEPTLRADIHEGSSTTATTAVHMHASSAIAPVMSASAPGAVSDAAARCGTDATSPSLRVEATTAHKDTETTDSAIFTAAPLACAAVINSDLVPTNPPIARSTPLTADETAPAAASRKVKSGPTTTSGGALRQTFHLSSFGATSASPRRTQFGEVPVSSLSFLSSPPRSNTLAALPAPVATPPPPRRGYNATASTSAVTHSTTTRTRTVAQLDPVGQVPPTRTRRPSQRAAEAQQEVTQTNTSRSKSVVTAAVPRRAPPSPRKCDFFQAHEIALAALKPQRKRPRAQRTDERHTAAGTDTSDANKSASTMEDVSSPTLLPTATLALSALAPPTPSSAAAVPTASCESPSPSKRPRTVVASSPPPVVTIAVSTSEVRTARALRAYVTRHERAIAALDDPEQLRAYATSLLRELQAAHTDRI